MDRSKLVRNAGGIFPQWRGVVEPETPVEGRLTLRWLDTLSPARRRRMERQVRHLRAGGSEDTMPDTEREPEARRLTDRGPWRTGPGPWARVDTDASVYGRRNEPLGGRLIWGSGRGRDGVSEQRWAEERSHSQGKGYVPNRQSGQAWWAKEGPKMAAFGTKRERRAAGRTLTPAQRKRAKRLRGRGRPLVDLDHVTTMWRASGAKVAVHGSPDFVRAVARTEGLSKRRPGKADRRHKPKHLTRRGKRARRHGRRR